MTMQTSLILRTILACLLVAGSSVVFPQAVPWLAAAWIVGYGVFALGGWGRYGLACLAAGISVLLFKRLTPAPGLMLLLVVMLCVLFFGIVLYWKGRQSLPRRFVAISIVVLIVAWSGMTWDWFAATHCRHAVTLNDRPVVCIGDSMTSLGMFGGYPEDLQQLIRVPVVNQGIGGISALQYVNDHLSELARHHPQVVVIEFGGHDFLRGQSRASTKEHLKTIIQEARKLDAEVILMEIPRSFMSDPYWGLEREIAREEGIELVPDTALRTIFLRSSTFPPGTWLGEPYLTDETGIHANARGNRMLAEAVADALQQMYGPEIRKHP